MLSILIKITVQFIYFYYTRLLPNSWSSFYFFLLPLTDFLQNAPHRPPSCATFDWRKIGTNAVTSFCFLFPYRTWVIHNHTVLVLVLQRAYSKSELSCTGQNCSLPQEKKLTNTLFPLWNIKNMVLKTKYKPCWRPDLYSVKLQSGSVRFAASE